MKIVRVRNAIGIGYMANVLIPPDDVDVEDYGNMLRDYLSSSQSDNLFILQAFDGDKLVAFLIAFTSGRNVSLHQLYEDDPPRDVLTGMFDMLTEWGINSGLSGIVIENIRGCEKLLPSGRFNPVSSTFRMDFASMGGGKDNGTKTTESIPEKSTKPDPNGEIHPGRPDPESSVDVDPPEDGEDQPG